MRMLDAKTARTALEPSASTEPSGPIGLHWKVAGRDQHRGSGVKSRASLAWESQVRFPVAHSVSFVVPALNEERNIRATIGEIRAAAAILDDHEIVIVNDASTDRTGEIADALAREDARIRVVHNTRNLGFGGAYKAGMSVARLPYVMMVPGDNNHPAPGITPILDLVGEADIVIPYVANPEVRGLKRRFISRAYTMLLNAAFGLRVPYYNGLVLHRTDLVQSICIETDGYAYQSEALIKLLRQGASSVAVPVALSELGDNRTRAFKLKNVFRVGKTILRLAIHR
jgi:glycosyltransferase involved in cell wall biosynthesis